MKYLLLSLLLCSCTTIEQRATYRATQVKHWQEMVRHGDMTTEDYEALVKRMGILE